MLQRQHYCQLLMPTTAADALILHTPGGKEGMGGSHELLQLQQQVGGRCLVRCGGVGALTTDGNQC